MPNARDGDRLDHFTGRHEEITSYDSLWAQSARRRVMGITGISGIGKSALLEYLSERHQPPRPTVLIDLIDPRLLSGYQFITALARELRLLFPRLPWRHYKSVEEAADKEDIQLRTVKPEIRVRQEQNIRGTNAHISQSPQTIIIHAGMSSELESRISRHEARCRTVLLDELCKALAEAPPFAILVDTYEVVAHSTDGVFCDWFSHEFLAAVERRLPQARTVLAGREGLPQRIPQYALKRWSRSDSDQFLAGYNLVTLDLPAAIFGHCQGHPQVTGLAVDVWEAGLASEQPLHPDQLRHGVNDWAATEWLMQQLYQRLPNGMGEIVKIAVRLRVYRPELINYMLGESTSEMLSDSGFATLGRFSLTERLPRGGLRAHDLVREVEDARFRQWPDAYQSFHLRASRYCHSSGALLDCLYHGIAADEGTFEPQWTGEVERHRLSFDWATSQELISLLEAPERRQYLRAETVGQLLFEQALLARSLADSGPPSDLTVSQRHAQAEALYRRVRLSERFLISGCFGHAARLRFSMVYSS